MLWTGLPWWRDSDESFWNCVYAYCHIYVYLMWKQVSFSMSIQSKRLWCNFVYILLFMFYDLLFLFWLYCLNLLLTYLNFTAAVICLLCWWKWRHHINGGWKLGYLCCNVSNKHCVCVDSVIVKLQRSWGTFLEKRNCKLRNSRKRVP